MAKYFLNFETIAEYNSSYDSLIKPNVSLIEENNTVKFKPSNSIGGHEYVEIGGIKWATMNIGAETETDYGLYFAWGDTQGYSASQVGANTVDYAKPFYYEDYKFNNGTNTWDETSMTKYNGSDNKTVLDLSDDAARLHWGGNWRMPTSDEFVALGNAVNTTWTASYNNNGVAGLVCTDKNDSSKVLFFPAEGECAGNYVNLASSCGYYWSSSLYTSLMCNAYNLYFDSLNIIWQWNEYRYKGRSIRPVHS